MQQLFCFEIWLISRLILDIDFRRGDSALEEWSNKDLEKIVPKLEGIYTCEPVIAERQKTK